MITQPSRHKLACEAVECFENQTYENRELIIVSDSEECRPYGQVPDNVRFVLIEDPKAVLGDMRNVAVDKAHGQLVAQWDDDDWSHPDRLKNQIEALLANAHDSVVLSRVTLNWKHNKQMVSEVRGWECTVVAWKERMPGYPSLAKGEDTPVTDAMSSLWIDRPDLYTYRFHGNNTWDEAHHARWWRGAA